MNEPSAEWARTLAEADDQAELWAVVALAFPTVRECPGPSVADTVFVT